MDALDGGEPKTWPALLALRAASSGSAVALRHKRLGEWRSQTWRELHRLVLRLGNSLVARGLSSADTLLVEGDPGPESLALTLAVQRLGGTVVWADAGCPATGREDARFVVGDRFEIPTPHARCARIAIDALEAERADEGSLAYSSLLADGGQEATSGSTSAGAGALRVRTSGGDEEISHAELVAEARALLASNHVGTSDRALSPTDLDPVATAVFVAAWLAGGFCVHFAETAETRDCARREVAPSLMFESATAYAEIHRRVLEALPSKGTLERRIVDWALAGGRRGPLQAVLADGLVRGPLRRLLGLSRVKHCLVVGGRVEGETLAFYATLGLTPSMPGDGRDSRAAKPPFPALSRRLDPAEPADGEAS